jgi:hypothetical protein
MGLAVGSRAVSWLERHPHIRSARRGVSFRCQEAFVFIIGIDPHKGSHTAAVIDRDEQLVAEMSVCVDRGLCFTGEQ